MPFKSRTSELLAARSPSNAPPAGARPAAASYPSRVTSDSVKHYLQHLGSAGLIHDSVKRLPAALGQRWVEPGQEVVQPGGGACGDEGLVRPPRCLGDLQQVPHMISWDDCT